MKNSTILFGLIVLVYILSMIYKDTFKQSTEENYSENKIVSSKIQSEEQLPIISFKRD